MRLKNIYDKYKAFLLDIDGVIRNNDIIIDGAKEACNSLISSGKKIIYFTNNSTQSSKDYALFLSNNGFLIGDQDIITSSQVIVDCVKKQKNIKKVFIVGERALREIFIYNGFSITDAIDADCVIVGYNPNVNYRQLAIAHQCLVNGAFYGVTNPDLITPAPPPLSTMPGAGAFAAFLSASSGRKPDIIAGKPYPAIYTKIFEKLNDIDKQFILAIGDNWDTDGIGAYNHSIDFLLVLSGVTQSTKDIKPLFVEEKLSDLFFKTKDNLSND